MAVTTVRRKIRRNHSVAAKKIASIKLLTRMPVIKNISIEELKKTVKVTKDS